MSRDSNSVITDLRAIDSDNFTICGDYSAIGIDRQLNHFFVTYDRIMFRKLPEVIQTILEANGFAVNFENILSCLDQLCFAIKSAHSDNSIRDGSPCLVIKFPDKQNIGTMLGSFYKEINKYEEIIASYHADSLSNSQQKRQDLERQISTLTEDNKKLQKKIDNLTAMLSQMHSAHQQALTEKNTLPAEMCFAKITDVLLDERLVILQSRNKTYRVALRLFDVIPNKKQLCLIVLHKEQITKLFTYGEGEQIIHPSISTTLYVKGERLKLRDDLSRRVHLFKANDDYERQQLEQLTRGTRVIIYLANEQLIKITPLLPLTNKTAFHDIMAERMIKATIDLTDYQLDEIA